MIMRIVFLVYWAYLTILLFSQDPTRWVGTPGNVPEFLRILMPYAHILSFTVLSFLTFAACFPLPWWGVMLSLAFYGGATEIIQGIVPHRTPDRADWFQDLGGVAIGFACFWVVVFLMRIKRRNESLEAPSSS
jgi:VanZ family protein